MPEHHLLIMIGEAVAIVGAICLSAFFSGSETALTSISLARISQIVGGEEENHPLADWLRNPSKYLTTLLVGNNITNIFGTLLCGDFCRRLVTVWPGPTWVETALPGTLAFFSMTLMLLMFGEILPKIYCRHHHERLAPKFVVWLGRVHAILRAPIRVLLVCVNFFIRMFGGEPASEATLVTQEDLKELIEVGQRQGLLEEGEREMLHSIFELSETPVREVMTPRINMIYVNINDDLATVLETFEKYDFSRLPVIQDNRDNVVGILYMKDLLHQWRNEAINGDAVRRLIRPALFVPESKRIDDILEQMQREKTHIAIVVDEYGGTEGLVTIEDILEEIVGEIEDEFDEEKEEVTEQPDGTWIVDATIDLEDLGEHLEIDFPEDGEFDSLAGMLIEAHGDLPKIEDVVEAGGFRYTILGADERRITSVKVERLPEEAPAEEIPEEEIAPEGSSERIETA
jgi:CBS domain containing-hemolysin-like protein